jgi:hypothetical protein
MSKITEERSKGISSITIKVAACLALLGGMIGLLGGHPTRASEGSVISSKDVVGNWTAAKQGETYWIVRINSVAPQPSGDFSHASTVEFDENGEVSKISGTEELKDFEIMRSPQFKNGHLLFSWTDRRDAGELEMTLTGPKTATLRFVNTRDKDDDANLRHLKPFQLSKDQ